MNGRAYSTFVLKSADDDQRIMTGIASTPSTDRVGDIVEPMGAQFKLPLPLLWHHDSEQPIGHVTHATPQKDGIPVTVKMVRMDEPGTLKDRLDESWQSIKSGLVRGLSIGFAPKEYSYIEETGGIHFQKWDWLELSAVTIPANSEANIATIKRYDGRGHSAAVGKKPWPFKAMSWDKTSPERFAAELGKYVLAAVGDIVAEGFAVRDVKLRALRESLDYQPELPAAVAARIKSLEDALAARSYMGVWQPEHQYREHNMATFKGSLWICKRDTKGIPGTTKDWQLAVRRGKDSHD